MFGNSSTSSTLGSVRKRLSKGFQRASEFITGSGPSHAKLLRSAILEGDEEKALQIYLNHKNENNANGNANDEPPIHPSMPFVSKKFNDTTPLHLACVTLMKRLIAVFMQNGGNPNVLDGKAMTSLHAACSRPDHVILRREVVEEFLCWKGPWKSDEYGGGYHEQISLNRVDDEGNTAIHYAAANGLILCVETLISAGAIISIVNKAQKTCCELADIGDYVRLAAMLELALVYQPIDENVAFIEAEQRFHNENQLPSIVLDSKTIELSEVENFIENSIDVIFNCLLFGAEEVGLEIDFNTSLKKIDSLVQQTLSQLTRLRCEVLLGAYCWDIHKLYCDLVNKPNAAFAAAHLQEIVVPSPPIDTNPWDFNTIVTPSESNVSQELIQLSITDKTCESDADKDMDEEVNYPVITDGDQELEVSVDDIFFDDDLRMNEIDTETTSTAHKDMSAAFVSNVPATVQSNNTIRAAAVSREGMNGDDDLKISDGISNQTIPPPKPAKPSVMQPPAHNCSRVDKTAAANDSPSDIVSPVKGTHKYIPEPCSICGDDILQPVSVEHALTGSIPQLERRGIFCDSGHGFCIDCWSGHLRSQVRDNGGFALQCPGFKCGEIIDIKWAPVLLKDKDLESRIRLQRWRHVVDTCAAMKWCPHEGCELIVILKQHSAEKLGAANDNQIGVDQFPQTAICDAGHSFCLACTGPAHAPCTCTDWRNWQQKVNQEIAAAGTLIAEGHVEGGGKAGEDIANAMWVNANTKRCPRCQTPIEKDEGCNHMTCRKCRHEFCWICMQDWSLHNSATGGFFQCNRFVAPTDENGTVGGGSMILDDDDSRRIFSEEMGSAHYETIRMKNKAKKMARFIHHYTRYNAHGESAAMEDKMHISTITRIHHSLLDTVNGRLKWLQGDKVPIPIDIHESKAYSQITPTSRDMNTDQKDVKSSEGTVSTIQSSSIRKTQSLVFAETKNDDRHYNTASGNGTARSFTSVFSLLNGARSTLALNTPVEISNGKINESSGEEVVGNTQVWKIKSTVFLNEGFNELIRCRKLLQSTFPFAFFAFGEDDNDNAFENLMLLSGLGLGMDASRRRGQAFSAAQQRAQKLRMANRRQDFEMMQSQLEMLTEMLSDVVARRRLRASSSQIVQATKAARSKRVEFESSLLSWYQTDLMLLQDASGQFSRERTARTTTRSTARSRAVQNDAWSNRLLQGGDSYLNAEDSLEIATLVAEIEALYNQNIVATPPSNERNANSSNESNRRDISSQYDMMDDLDGDLQEEDDGDHDGELLTSPSARTRRSNQRQSQPASSSRFRQAMRAALSGAGLNSFRNSTPEGTDTSPNRINNLSPPRPRGLFGSLRLSSGQRRNRNHAEEEDEERSLYSEDLTLAPPMPAVSNAALRSAREASEDDAEHAQDSTGMVENTDEDRTASRQNVARIAAPANFSSYLQRRQAEEVAALNRAILISLQDVTPDRGSFEVSENQDSSSLNNIPLSEEHIDLLVTMGFAREDAERALRASKNNVDAAANILLNAM